MLDIQANVVSPHALGDGLHLVALCLGGQPHRGHQLLLLPLDLLILDLNLLPSLYNLHKLRIIPLFFFIQIISHYEKNSNPVNDTSSVRIENHSTLFSLFKSFFILRKRVIG